MVTAGTERLHAQRKTQRRAKKEKKYQGRRRSDGEEKEKMNDRQNFNEKKWRKGTLITMDNQSVNQPLTNDQNVESYG